MLFRRRRPRVEAHRQTLRELISSGASIEAVRSAAAAQPASRPMASRHAPVRARLHRYTAHPAAPAAGS